MLDEHKSRLTWIPTPIKWETQILFAMVSWNLDSLAIRSIIDLVKNIGMLFKMVSKLKILFKNTIKFANCFGRHWK